MPGGKRLWRTDDGKLVEDGDPKAVLLAYGEDDELEGDDVGLVGKAKAAVKAVAKKAADPVKKPAANKGARRPAAKKAAAAKPAVESGAPASDDEAAKGDASEK